MVKTKTFSVSASPDILLRLAEAITCYTKAAYPPGGSECSQVTSDTLLTTARSIQQGSVNGEVELRSRQRRILIAAVNWYCAETPGISEPLRQKLSGLLVRSK